MNIQPEFPQHRRQDPRRGAEAGVYDQLARSTHPGHVLYELKPLPEAPELDFGIWLQDQGRFGLQVKGGHYVIKDTAWNLHTIRGTEHVPCPLTQTWDAAVAVRDAVYRVLGFKVFIIPVLLLPDTPHDPTIKKWARQRRIRVIFGADDLVDRLLELAGRTEVKHPPTADHILNEVEAVTNGLVVSQQGGANQETGQELTTRQVLIQHVDTVHIHVTQAGADGRDPTVLRAG